MNQAEFATLLSNDVPTLRVSVSDLKDKRDRTLLFGFDCDRNDWHVYLKGGKITLFVYDRFMSKVIPVRTLTDTVFEAATLVPDKHLYPECCDLEFCELLLRQQCYLPFGAFVERPVSQFYGEVSEDPMVSEDPIATTLSLP